ELGQHDVEQDQLGVLAAPELVALRPVRGGDDLVALLLERVLQQALDVGIVIDDEDLGHALLYRGEARPGRPEYSARPSRRRSGRQPAADPPPEVVGPPPAGRTPPSGGSGLGD